MKAYIYQIKNEENGKLYIGSTKDSSRRFYEHKYDLQRQMHHAAHLQKAWNKYGEQSFTYSILEETEIELRFKRERFWILTERTLNPDYGYNTVLPDENGGYYKTDEMKEKISQGVVNKLLEQRGRVVLIDLVTQGETFYNSVKEMRSKSRHSTNSKLGITSKTYWCYEFQRNELTPTELEKLLEMCTVIYDNAPKKVFAFNFETEMLIGEFPSKESAAKELGIETAQIYHIFNRSKKSVKGLTFSETEDFPNIQKHRKDKKHFGKRIRQTVPKTFKYQITNGESTFQSYTVPELVNHVSDTTKKGWQKLASGDRKSYKGYMLERL